jgi:hypothetical protein
MHTDVELINTCSGVSLYRVDSARSREKPPNDTASMQDSVPPAT